MRLDKYLKITRLIKRRTIANDACDAGKILVNDKVARASYKIKIDDIITINMGQRPLKVKVLSITEHATKENAADNYIVVEWRCKTYMELSYALEFNFFFGKWCLLRNGIQFTNSETIIPIVVSIILFTA